MSVTLDTNVLIYAIDGRDPAKQRTAGQVVAALGEVAAPLALQVIGEFQHAMTRRMKVAPAVAAAAAHQLLASFRTFPYDETSVERAISAFATGRLSYWDGLLIASAERAGVRVLISEDMQDGGRIGEVEVVNPFSADGLSPRASAVLNL